MMSTTGSCCSSVRIQGSECISHLLDQIMKLWTAAELYTLTSHKIKKNKGKNSLQKNQYTFKSALSA